jgi:hypothetical protein
MSKRIMIGLFALSVVAFLRTEANAGCAVIAGFQICASWITGGSEVGLVTARGFNDVGQSCDVLTTQAGQPSGEPIGEGSGSAAPSILQTTVATVDLKLAGTVPTTAGQQCGLDAPNDQCDIRGAAFCGASEPPMALTLPLAALTTATTFGWPDGVDNDDDKNHPRARRATTLGPLTASSPLLGQNDSSNRSFAGFRFQITGDEQTTLCPGREFLTFIAREGFFQACVGVDPDRVCVRERCTVDVNGIGPDDPRVYRCRPL